MVADDLGQWLPPHDPATGELLEVTPEQQASILPSPAAWQTITAVREDHHARLEAEREARRLKRQQENSHAAKLALITDADMPDQPAFLRGKAAA
jgi:hypothetical protein